MKYMLLFVGIGGIIIAMDGIKINKEKKDSDNFLNYLLIFTSILSILIFALVKLVGHL